MVSIIFLNICLGKDKEDEGKRILALDIGHLSLSSHGRNRTDKLAGR
jgi:hypothetical protein